MTQDQGLHIAPVHMTNDGDGWEIMLLHEAYVWRDEIRNGTGGHRPATVKVPLVRYVSDEEIAAKIREYAENARPKKFALHQFRGRIGATDDRIRKVLTAMVERGQLRIHPGERTCKAYYSAGNQ